MINWGICGASDISNRFIKAVQSIGGTVIGVASRNIKRAEEFKRNFNLLKAYGSYEEMSVDKDIDAVYIATVNSEHIRCAEIYVKAGKPVLIEKPIAVNAAELKRLHKLAKLKKVLIMEAMWTKFLPAVNFALEKIRSGEIGEVVYAEAKFCEKFHESKVRAFRNDMGGGVLLDLGIYTFNIMDWILGGFDTIKSETFVENGIDKTETVIVKNKNNAFGIIVNSMLTSSTYCAVYGIEGNIRLPYFCGATEVIITKNGKEEHHNFAGADGFTHEIKHFEQLIKDGKTESGIMPVSHSLKILGYMDALRKDWGLVFPNDL